MRLHRVWSQPVISVEKKDVFPPAGAEPGIACLRHTSIFLSHISNTGITRHHLCRIIRRAVVNYDNFDSAGGLRQSALDSSRQEMRLLIAGDNNGGERATMADLA